MNRFLSKLRINCLKIIPQTEHPVNECFECTMVYDHVFHADEANLNLLARERGFTTQDVRRDGNRLFLAVKMQLQSIGIRPLDTGLREHLVKCLQSHPHTR